MYDGCVVLQCFAEASFMQENWPSLKYFSRNINSVEKLCHLLCRIVVEKLLKFITIKIDGIRPRQRSCPMDVVVVDTSSLQLPQLCNLQKKQIHEKSIWHQNGSTTKQQKQSQRLENNKLMNLIDNRRIEMLNIKAYARHLEEINEGIYRTL